MTLSGGALSHVHRLFWDELGMCACGDPDTARVLVRDLLALAPFHEHPRAEVVALIGTEGAFHLVLTMLENVGLIDHGFTLNGSWLTDKGRWYLQALQQIDDWSVIDADGIGSPEHECTDACWTAAVSAQPPL
ncbi:hypothetical protein ACIP9H_34000 [Streptomyces sp. NPDC088732]|uniref:hypothetical protein n=1 Tax=Streptomyces sp. NPDC088732 TaxID=3365879 RepID=UPI0037F79C68